MYFCKRKATFFYNEKNSDNRSKRFHRQFHRRGGSPPRHGDMGGCEVFQLEGIPQRQTNQLHRTGPQRRATTHRATQGPPVRLCRSCCRRDKMYQQGRLPTGEYRGDTTPGSCPEGATDADRAICVPEQPQRDGGYTRTTTIYRDQRRRHATAEYSIRQE